MKRIRTFIICGGLATLYALPLFTLPGLGAIFLKIDTIPGESTDAKHKDWIEILSWNHGSTAATGAGTGSTGQGGRECIQDLRFTKFIDKASPKLMLQCFKGTTLPNDVTLVATESDGAGSTYEYLTIKLVNVVVSAVSNAGEASAPDRPVESFAINFTKIAYSYVENDAAKTKTEVRWDLEANQEY